MRPMREMTRLTYETDRGHGARARIGIIVLETDRTLEPELRCIDLDGVAFFHSRIPMDPSVTADNLGAMEAHLPAAAALLPVGFEFDAIGYGCTSASTLIGDDAVAGAIQASHAGTPCTNPIAAAICGLKTLGVERLGVVTPYAADLTDRMASHFEAQGFSLPEVASFFEPDDFAVSRITLDSIAAAARQIGSNPDCDAVFLSCTNLRTFELIDALEAELAKPVVSSNQALGWHLLRLAGVSEPIAGLGTLFQRPLANAALV